MNCPHCATPQNGPNCPGCARRNPFWSEESQDLALAAEDGSVRVDSADFDRQAVRQAILKISEDAHQDRSAYLEKVAQLEQFILQFFAERRRTLHTATLRLRHDAQASEQLQQYTHSVESLEGQAVQSFVHALEALTAFADHPDPQIPLDAVEHTDQTFEAIAAIDYLTDELLAELES